MGVEFVRAEVSNMLDIYETIEDCIAGEKQVKSKETKYLPKPNAADPSRENTQRYADYLQRAVFYNVVGPTLDGLLGQIFKKGPEAEIPTELSILFEDVDGSGVGLNQFAKTCCAAVLDGGRCGVLVDYPQTEGAVSKADLEGGNIRPVMRAYKSKDIINWRKESFGAKQKFTLLVLKEQVENLKADGFEIEYVDQWRVLRLIDGVYTQEIYRQSENMSVSTGITVVTGFDGQPLDEIQFEIIGVRNNDIMPVKPPIYDIAILNIAHYRNSADYEESSFICGQPTPFFSGLSEEWVTNVLKGQVQLGSRAAVPLPLNGQAGIIQATANMVPFEAMGHKEKQMVALGAKLVQDRQVQRSATEAGMEASSEASVLTSIAQNVSIVIQDALKRACVFLGIEPGEITYKLNTEFDTTAMDAQSRAQLIKEWQSGAISFKEMRKSLKDGGIAYLEDEVALEEIEEEKAIALEEQQEQMELQNQESVNEENNVAI
jgi:hypothetical protein